MKPVEGTVRQQVAFWTRSGRTRPLLIDPTSERALEYGELDERARCLAALVESSMPADGSRLAFATRDSYEAAELFVTALHAGMAFVPLNVEAGTAHLRAVIERGRIAVIVAAPDLVAEASQWCEGVENRPRVVTTDELAECGPGELMTTGPDDEAFVMYTSGSTGTPKGVVLSQRNAVAAGTNNQKGYHWSEEDRVLCPLPFWHMNACDKALGAIASGASMVVPPRFLVGEFWNWTMEHRPTVMIIVPTVAVELLQHQVPDSDAFETALQTVRYAGSSSAPLNAAVHEDFVARFGIPMIEAFGMSETGSIFITTPPPETGTAGSVGKPAGWEVRVVDNDGTTLPVGEVGALELKGDALTIGYDDSDVFAASLTEDGWFKTGDIGRFNEQQEFFVVGRAKEIVIKGGVNIAPREIDEVVATHPTVVEVATVGVPDPLLGQDIETFVVFQEGADVDEAIAEISTWCLDQLGVLKTPRRISAIAELPRGPGGKVQPLKLLDLVEAQEQAEPRNVRTDGVAGDTTNPNGQFEKVIHQLWESLLSVDSLGVHENFFDRGGYSLLALECCVNLRSELRLHVPLSTMFENPTVASFAQILIAQAWLGTEDYQVSMTPPVRDVRQLADVVGTLDPTSRGALEGELFSAERVDDDHEPEAEAILLNHTEEHDGLTLPLFCPYGPHQYATIAAHLADTTPVYGLFTSEETGGTELAESASLERLTASYIGAMRMVQPEGPYHLLGFSFGGRMSLEMAAQLSSLGQEVALVAPIDTYLGGFVPPWHPRMVRRTISSRVGRVVGRGRRSFRERDEAPASEFVERVRAEQVQYRRELSLGAEPPSYAGEITLFRAKRVIGGRLARSQNRDLGWDRITDRLVRHDFAGTHHDLIFDPIAAEIAEVVRSRIVKPQTADRPRRTRVYLHPLIDSRRWDTYTPRNDDIVISTSMKAGTTWMQRIVGMLVLGSADPIDLDAHSPWIESRTGDPTAHMMDLLEKQGHRRFLKTHLPADALPFSEDVSYIVVGRDSRDVFLSMHNHYANYTPEVLRTFNALPGQLKLDPAPETARELWPQWISSGTFPWEQDGAPFWSHHHHASSFWRFRHRPNILFVHYDDLLADLPAEISRIAAFLGVEVGQDQIEAYAAAASFAAMKSDGATLVPHAEAAFQGGSKTFFNQGVSARWRKELSADDLELYEQNVAKTLTHDLRTWLEGGRRALGHDPADAPSAGEA